MYYNIDHRCPEIRGDNWKECCDQGWRHIGNARENLVHQNSAYIRYLQYIHGITNVTIGDPFDDLAFKPRKDSNHLSIGIYVRDVAEMVSHLYDEIRAWEES